jgi:hypothetical protein
MSEGGSTHKSEREEGRKEGRKERREWGREGRYSMSPVELE